ncbi:UNVERIFIED_CONTAM: Ycf54-like protein [Sesamum radiatum]|uniref:Ycf54-like protein n=1 Tax=Sesamum radiatum TaxID=300843 RepID=A0AAW2ULV8_SESRA
MWDGNMILLPIAACPRVTYVSSGRPKTRKVDKSKEQLILGSHVSFYYSESWLLGSQLLNSPTHKPLSPFLLPATKPFLKSSNPIGSSCWKLTTSVRTAVAAVDSSDPTEKEVEEAGSKEYHFVVANAKFMLDEEEHFKELLSERLRNYGERNKEQDFWLVIEPKFLDKFPNITKRLKRPAVALVSTNGPWIKYMKLRLDRVLQESFEADSLEEALASNPLILSLKSRRSGLLLIATYDS